MADDVELIVRGGRVVDGSGSEPYEADILVSGGRIAAIERNSARRGAEEIDARGRIVTPGFVDLHTHYDGQATWDSRLAPSSLHGVTTAIMGNCGVGFAPCRPAQRDQLIRLMEGIEDIPGAVLTEGIPWNWESYPDYLDALGARHYAIDIGGYLPHAALRVYAMGERASRHEAATADDLALMSPLVQAAVRAGAFGLGTSRTIFHRSSDGQSVPTLRASEEELTTLASAVKAGAAGAGGGILQYAVDWDDAEATFGLIRRVLERSGCPTAFSLVQQNQFPDNWRKVLEMTAEANDAGLPISVQVMPRAIGMLLSHNLTLNPFCTTESYKALAHLKLPERLTQLHRPEIRARIIEEATDPNPTNLLATFVRDFERIYPLGDPPDYEPPPGASIAAEAGRRGMSAAALAYDLLLERDGQAMLFVATVNYAGKSLDATLEMLKHRDTVPGLGDAGAHLGVMCDGSYATFMLTHWARDRKGERIPLPTVVRSLSHDTARVIGLNDRGLLRPGYRADMNVIDFDRLQLGQPLVMHDLPAGGRRIIQGATGYDATMVAGVVTMRDGISTGALPGRLVRGAQAGPEGR
jgi:N-acyl-D-aspartate/D-glutamate deacylase